MSADQTPPAGRTRRRGLVQCAGLLIAYACLISANAAEQRTTDDGRPIQVTFGGGSARGTFAAIGEGLGEMIRRQYPGSSYTYEPGSLVGAFARIVRGSLPIGIAGAAEITAALNGRKPYSRTYTQDDFSVVARIADRMQGYVVMRKDFADRYSLSTWSDIAKRKPPMRFSMGQLGNLSVYNQSTAFLNAIGVTRDDIEAWGGTIYLFPLRASIDLIKDNKADATFSAGFHPDARLFELERSTPIVFLPLGEGAVTRVAQEFGASIDHISAEHYGFLHSDYLSTSFGIYILAGPGATANQIYKITKALHKNFDMLTAMHPTLAAFEPSMLPKGEPYQLHPAAAQYYREVGLLR